MDSRMKKYIMSQNTYMCKYGMLNKLPVFVSIKNYYNPTFSLGTSYNFADVYVKSVHPLLIARECVNKGLFPVILHTVTSEFNGANMESSEGIYDDTLNIRSNFHRTLNSTGLYPIKGAAVVYAPKVTIIRDEGFQINTQTMFSIGVINASPIHEPETKTKKTQKNKKKDDEDENNAEDADNMNIDNYFTTKETIENIFQTAINGNHDVLILTDFGCKYNKHSVKDIVDIYNLSILKYGHMFKYIYIAIPIREHADMAFYAYFSKEIIKPQELVDNNKMEHANINQTNPINEITNLMHVMQNTT